MAQARAAAMLSPQARPEMVEQVRRTMAAIDPAGYTQAVHLLAQGRLLHDVSQLRLPVTVASGEADTITPPQLNNKSGNTCGKGCGSEL